jgi:hypothetical protein
MTITNGYVDLNDFAGWAPGGSELAVSLKETAIEAASRWIDQHCQRHFWQATATARVFDACNPYTLRLGSFNDLVSVDASGLKTDTTGDGTFDTTWATSDFQLLPLRPAAAPETRPYDTVRAVAGNMFPVYYGSWGNRIGRVQITGTWGWAAVPDAVRQACLIQAFRAIKRRDSPEGVTGFDQFGTIRIGNRADPDVVQLLAPYRRTSLLVA